VFALGDWFEFIALSQGLARLGSPEQADIRSGMIADPCNQLNPVG
jgi:hypothetical protein